MLTEEIRINKKFASICESDYNSDPPLLGEDSEPVIRTRMLSTKRYLKKLTSTVSREQILPPNTRFHEKFASGNLFVIEEPPSLRTITVDTDMWGVYQRLKSEGKLEEYGIENYLSENERPYRFTLAFPYIIFILGVNREGYSMCTSVFFRTQPLIGLSDYVLMAPMYNVPESQYMCLGSEGSNLYESATAAAINSMNVFWNATFCSDYTHNVAEYADVPGLCDYFTWEHMSRTNPMFIYTAHWKQFGETLFSFIERLKHDYNLSRSYEMINYKAIKNAFLNPEPTEMEKEIRKGGHKYRLYDNISNGIYLKNTEQLNVGDSFSLANGNTGTIETFLGNQDGDAVTHMNIITEGQRKLLKLSPEFKKYIYKQVMKDRYVESATIQDGQELKANDIIKVRNKMGNDIFKKVKYIRKAQDDELEILMGPDYYLASSIKTVEKLDIQEPKVGDLVLKKNVPYFIYRGRVTPQPFREASQGEFDCLDVNQNGRVLAKFTTPNELRGERTVEINTDNSTNRSSHIVEMDDSVRPLPVIYKLGRRVWASYSENGGYSKDSVWGTPDGIVYRRNNYSDTPGIRDVFKEFVKDDKFTAQSFDYDDQYSIGDLVVIANWDDPNDMLSVKEIEGFKLSIDEQRGHDNVDFVLKSKDGTLSTITYIDYRKNIQSGKIRKVVTKLNGLEVGMKITAKESGICNFPKKDTNIIVAFVIDGGHEPLVLCSNACTLWISDVEEKFEMIPRSSDEWETLQHAPIEIDKIKFQPGDILISTNFGYSGTQGYTVFRNRDNRGLKVHPNEYYHNSPEASTLDTYLKSSVKFDCIPLPRLTQKQQDDLGIIGAYPNFHGAFTPSINARLYFLNDGRALINV